MQGCMSGRDHLQVAVTSLLFRVPTVRQDKDGAASSSYTTAIYDVALLSIRRYIGAYESVVSEGMSLSFASKFLYMFSSVRAAVNQLGAPFLTAHFYTCGMLSTVKSVLYRSNT